MHWLGVHVIPGPVLGWAGGSRREAAKVSLEEHMIEVSRALVV